uniref:Photosystem I protein M n=1 Tax=Astrosyne radiata TaxID=1158023 RepID=A0A2U9NT92_9STRA|nr:photosystem I protein M [Astrosyne radiata]AWT40289.1 photosystem I protein M [Astrosyne radiata]
MITDSQIYFILFALFITIFLINRLFGTLYNDM